MLVQQYRKRMETYKSYRLTRAKEQKKYFHPRWFEEEQFFHEECRQIESQRSAFWQDSWNIFECSSLILVLVMFILHIVNALQPDKDVFKAAKLISSMSLLFVYFRLYKTLRIFSLFSEFTVLLGNILTETVRILLIFMDFYIPYVFIIYMLFGGDEENADRTKLKQDNKLNSIIDVAYQMWMLTFSAPIHEEPLNFVNIKVSQLAIGSYFVLMTALFVYIYIGRMSQVFSRVYRQSKAKATMLFAKIIVDQDYSLGIIEKLTKRKYLRKVCGPLVIPFESVSEEGDDRQNINIGVSHITSKLDDISTFLGKCSFHKEQNKRINLTHLSTFNTEVEKLTNKQHENELQMQKTKNKLSKEQQRAIKMIKETVQDRTNKAMKKKRHQTEKSEEKQM